MRTPLLTLIIGLLLATTGFATAAVVGTSDLPATVAQSTNPGNGGSSGNEGSGRSEESANEANESNGHLASTGLGVGGLLLASGILVGSGLFVRRSQAGQLS